jgi:hypothetical protein
MTKCPKCDLEHDQVDVLRWLWLLRDTKPKPPGVQLGVLVMLAARMDGTTGCGWTTDPDLAELAGVADVGTVRAATRWGRDRLLLHRISKGYRITDERTEKSHWLLTDPDRPTGNRLPHGKGPTGDRLPHGKASQPGAGSLMAAEPTGDLSGANRGFEPDPTGVPSPSKASPEKLIQEANPSPRRQVVNSSLEGVRDGQGDDDDSKIDKPDPRTILAGLGVDDPEAGIIIARLEEGGIRDPATFMLGIIAKGDGEAREWLDWIRR